MTPAVGKKEAMAFLSEANSESVDPKRALLSEFFSEPGFVVRLHDGIWDEAALQRLLTAQREYLTPPRDAARFERDVAQAFWLPHREARRYCAQVAPSRSNDVCERGSEQLYDMAYWLFMGEPVSLDDTTSSQAFSALPACSADELQARQAVLDESLAEDGFLLRLRCELEWDRDGFARLVNAMRGYVAAQGEAGWLDREAAEVFWYVEWFVPQWASHPNFPRKFAPEHYAQAFDDLRDLAILLFVGNDSHVARQEQTA